MPLRSARARHGFTLIEIMAVVIIMGLTLTWVLPNLAATHASRLKGQARDLVSRLELARERAVVTSIPHRVMIDLEEGSYRVDWFVTEERAAGIDDEWAAEDEPPPPEEIDESSNAPVSLTPPRGEVRDYYPIPNRFGGDDWLPEDYYFEGVQTPEGWIQKGSVQIVFERDGTSDFAEIVLADTWDNSLTLEIQPLLDTVRIHDDEEP